MEKEKRKKKKVRPGPKNVSHKNKRVKGGRKSGVKRRLFVKINKVEGLFRLGSTKMRIF